MKDTRQSLARWGEEYAAAYLKERGYQVLERNVRTSYGEIDLVAASNDAIAPAVVFLEVKTRSTTSFGYPEEAITRRKQLHMLAAAQAYMQAHPELGLDWRLDVMAIFRPDPQQPPTVLYIEDAVHDEG